MSKKNKNNGTQEPWEQPIYDTETEESYSRTSQRRQKRGSSTFLTIVLILIFLIVAIPVVAGFWVMNRNNQPDAAETAQSSTVETTEISTTSTSEAETTETTVISESEPEETETTPETTTPETTTPETTPETTTPETNAQEQNEEGAVYATVQPGDGPQQVADRAGISLEEIVRLNNIDLNNYLLQPGDQLRVK